MAENNDILSQYPRIKRIMSMLLDHIIMIIVIAPPMIVLIILGIAEVINLESKATTLLFCAILCIYLNKDFFNAKSPAKRILGYQVIDRKSQTSASALQCFIRNLTIGIAWPLEVIITLFSPKRRIGDLIANTKVITSDKKPLLSLVNDAKNTSFKINYLGILIIGGLYFYGLSQLLPGV